MPQTVPNRPTKGAVEPIVASELRWRSNTSSSRSRVSDMTLPIRSSSARAPLPPGGFGESRHSSIAAANSIAIG
ncbi:MAG: hypothetical protein K0S35_1288 [Geminicoccaceae bacterium]|nr:hypothetical protein [Geminicoccaceae bacterium]